MDSIVTAFHLDIKILIAQLINFAVVIFVLYRYAIKPLGKLMSERSATIDKGLKDAKTNAETLIKTESEYEKALANARKDASDIFSKAKKEAEVKKQEMMEDAKKEVARMLAQGTVALAEEKRKMLDDAKKELVGLVASATEKVLTKGVNEKIDGMIIEQSVSQFK
jgi:F-type H+-transporting ATPase subunit b